MGRSIDILENSSSETICCAKAGDLTTWDIDGDAHGSQPRLQITMLSAYVVRTWVSQASEALINKYVENKSVSMRQVLGLVQKKVEGYKSQER